MRVHCELGFYKAEHSASILRRCVMTDDPARRRRRFQVFRFRRRHFMKQDISSLREADQVFAEPCITREHNRPALIVYAVAKRRFDELTMIHIECRDSDATLFIDHTLSDFLRNNCGTGWRKFLVRDPNPNVCPIRLLQVQNHLPGSDWTIDVHWFGSLTESRVWQPSGQPQIGKPHDVVRMKMCEKYGSHIAHRNMDLRETYRDASTTIKEQFLWPCFDENARSEPLD